MKKNFITLFTEHSSFLFIPLAIVFYCLCFTGVSSCGFTANDSFCIDSSLLKHETTIIKNENTVYQWRRQYVRENKKGVVPTLTANMGTGGHNVPLILDKKGIRKLTPKECLNAQGFPKNYKVPSNLADSKIYKQAGNSVSVTVVERVAKNMMKALLA
jgi:site-specific DNA-cytosine methylase